MTNKDIIRDYLFQQYQSCGKNVHFTTKQLSRELQLSKFSICKNLTALESQGIIMKDLDKRKHTPFIWATTFGKPQEPEKKKNILKILRDIIK
jgi:predicted transcriptional regulator